MEDLHMYRIHCIGCKELIRTVEEPRMEKVIETCNDCDQMKETEVIQIKKEIFTDKEKRYLALVEEIHELHGDKKNKILISYKQEECELLKYQMSRLVKDIRTLKNPIRRGAFFE